MIYHAIAHEHQRLQGSVWKSESPEPTEQDLTHSGAMNSPEFSLLVKNLYTFLKKCACMRAKLNCDRTGCSPITEVIRGEQRQCVRPDSFRDPPTEP